MKATAILTAGVLLALSEAARGMATEEIGPKESCPSQPDWPKGIVEVARHPARVYSLWCNGAETLYFQADPAQVNELVALFCKAAMREHHVKFETGPRAAKSFRGTEYDYNVALQITGGIVLAMKRSRESTSIFDPCLTIYVGPDRDVLKQLTVPTNAIVQCDVEGVSIPGKATAPVRTTWYGRIRLGDTEPSHDTFPGLVMHVTLWRSDSPDGIEVASVSLNGLFHGAFSEAEIAALKQGTSWLTVTAGNFAIRPKKEDPRFPPALLAREEGKAEPFSIPGPKYYWGRLLFEDGSPAILDAPPWPGAKIWPDFPYAGMTTVDSQGYFKVCFTDDQFNELKSRKPSRNIYIPMEKRGRSTAMEVFPPGLLSQDKDKAGVVRIAKPVFKPRYDEDKAPSLLGKPLPPLQPLKLDIYPAAISNRVVLLCFFDVQERPSRRCVAELARSAEDLKSKGVFVAGIQTSAVGADVLDAFARTNHVPFPLGAIRQEEAKTKFDWGLRSQPWLILTDRDHLVTSEGFAIGELNDKLQALR